MHLLSYVYMDEQQLQITTTSESTADIDAFMERVWPLADREHYGRDVDFTKTKFCITARVGTDVVGVAKIQLKAGVCRIDELLVDPDRRRQKVGSGLITETERIAQQHACHRVTLLTGKEWEAVSFYTSQGYTVIATLADYYAHADFVEMTKALPAQQ